MPTASGSGTRNVTRRNWRVADRPRSRLGPRSRPRPNPFAELGFALDALIRFHQSHPAWFPPASCGGGLRPSSPALSPEWEAAIRQAYHPDPPVAADPPDVPALAGESPAAPSASIRDQN